MSKILKTEFNCQYCNETVKETLKKYNRRKRYNCSKIECISKAKSNVGSYNPMYGKTHSDKIKKEQSIRATNQFKGKTYQELYGVEKTKKLKEIRSKIFSETNKNHKRWVGKKHNNKSKEKIGSASKKRYTKEYLKKQREIRYKTGQWIDPKYKTDYTIYYELSNWKKPMWNILIKEENNKNKLRKHKVFNNKTNTNGVVRDHKFSREDGWKLKIFPEILRHPVNCQILTNSENSSKRRKSDITIDNLFTMIYEYKDEWYEQDLVKHYVNCYNNGDRWSLER